MKGYEEAEKIDLQINELLDREPMTEENALEWLKLARTIKTTCEVLQEVAIDIVCPPPNHVIEAVCPLCEKEIGPGRGFECRENEEYCHFDCLPYDECFPCGSEFCEFMGRGGGK
jgi:hypothetical protein